MIDMASVYAERFKTNPQALQAAVMGQSPDPKLDPYTALNALKLVKEANMMEMAGKAQQPTSAPSIVAENMAPAMPQGLGAMVPGAMGNQGMPPQGMPLQQRAPMPQPTMQAASGGLAGMYTPEEDYAEGGIIAFQSQGFVDPRFTEGMVANAVTADPMADYAPAVSADPFARSTEVRGDGEEDDYLAMLDKIESGEGSPAGFAAANKLALAAARRIASRSARDLTPKEVNELYATELKKITTAAGPSPYIAMREDIAQQKKERTGNLNIAQGEALLEAASAVLEGNNAIRGLAKGGAQFAKSYGAAQRADQAAKRSMANMEFAISDAERKERMGNSRAATAAVENRRKSIADYNKTELERDKALGRLATDMGRFNRPAAKAAGAGSGDASTKLPQVDRSTAEMQDKLVDMKAANPDDPKIKILEDKIASRLVNMSTGREGPTAAPRAAAALTGAQNRQLSKEMDTWRDSTEAKKAIKMGNFDEVYDAEFTRRQNALMSGISTTPTTGTVLNYDINGKRIN